MSSCSNCVNTVSNIESKLRQQDELVRQRIHQQARFTQLAASLIATTEELNDLADSLVANAAATTTAITSSLYDLVENNADDRQLYSVFDRLVEVDLDAMERMYELRLRSANLNGLFSRVAKESELDELDILRKRTTETISILKRRVTEINDPQRRQKASELLRAMEVYDGPLYVYDIFETRVSLLRIDKSLTQLSLDTAKASQTLRGYRHRIERRWQRFDQPGFDDRKRVTRHQSPVIRWHIDNTVAGCGCHLVVVYKAQCRAAFVVSAIGDPFNHQG